MAKDKAIELTLINQNNINQPSLSIEDKSENATIYPAITSSQRKLEIKDKLYANRALLNLGKCTEEEYKLFLELSDLYINEENIYNYPKALALYHYADQAAKANNLLNKVEINRLIETVFNKFQLLIESNNIQSKSIAEYKKELADLRNNIELMLVPIADLGLKNGYLDTIELSERTDKIKNIYSNIKDSLIGKSGLITRIIQDCISELGDVPKVKGRKCGYCVYGMGSMSLSTITLWSDLEFGILIESNLSQEDEKIIKDFFRKFTVLLNMKIVDFGETILPSMFIPELNNYYSTNKEDNWFFDNIMPRGISFDGEMLTACKTPLGRKEYGVYKKFELICTPKELVQFQEGKWYEEDTQLVQSLWNIVPITGNSLLINDYEEELLKYKDITKFRAFEILRQDTGKLNPLEQITMISKDRFLMLKKTYIDFLIE